MKRCKGKVVFLSVLIIFFMITGVVRLSTSVENKVIKTTSYEYHEPNLSQCRYLSDIKYIKDQSNVGWGSITLDQNLENSVNNGLISLVVEGKKKLFFKGISAHATSTLVYDLSGYNYDYFSAYYGVDAGRGSNGNGVKFAIYTSKDGTNWDLHTKISPPVKKGDSEAEFIKIDIKGVKYLKLYAHNNGNESSDHAVYADAKLFKAGYVEDTTTVDFIKTVEEYNSVIKGQYSGQDDITGELEFNLLKREFVKNVGYDLLQSFVKYSDDNKATISWLMNDIENLRLYILGGKPDGSYINSLKELVRLYTAYKADFDDATPTNNKWYPNLTKGDVYKKMAISLSLTHSTKVGYWAQIDHPSNRSDSLNRYRIYKDLYDRGKFVVSSRQDHTPWYEALHIEEMRYIMNNITDDEELLWFNEYTQKRIDAHPGQEEKYLQPHTYIAYVWPDFGNPIFHDPERKEYWDEKFEGIFSKYGVTYSKENDKVKKAWMSMRNEFGTGAVCGGISKLGCHIRAAHGTPASVISQPGHAAIIYYRKDTAGNGYWTIDNDVSGWAQSGKTEKLGTRMPLGWGNDSYVSGWAATYIVMSQEALNHKEEYEKSEKLIMLADVYKSDAAKKEKILRKALNALSYNVDAWWELIKLYQANPDTTEAEYFALAEEIAENLKYYPLPMYNLINLLKNNLPSIEYSFSFTLLQNRILNEGKNLPNNTAESYSVYQPSITRTVASFLLGQADTSLAKFSFDGEDAGRIVLSNRYDGNGVRWDYSIDGKKTWKEVSFTANEEHKLKLSEKELESITAENDIYVHIVGVNYDEKNLYQIDIKEQEAPTTIYNNDLENRVIGATDTMEWRMVNKKSREGNGWTSFKDGEPDLTGDKTVEVRIGKTGVYLESESVTLDYTKDIIDDTKKYVSISHLSIENVSTEATGQGRYAKNAIDGNYNTNWHSAWNGSDSDKYITIKVGKPIYLSALDYVPAGGGNGKILEGKILGSLDGKNYQEIGTVKWGNNEQMKTITFDNPSKVQYIKIVGTRTSSAGGGSFITARMFNLYEDTTKVVYPTANIKYDKTTPTNGSVIATLVNPSTEITVTNNNGKNTYKFTKNGSFTFEFVDNLGNVGTATATVDWIDKSLNNTITNDKIENVNNTEAAKETNGNYTLKSDIVDVVLSDNVSTEDVTIEHNQLSLSDNLKKQVSGESEYFELYFRSGTTKSKKIGTSSIKVLLKVDPNRKLIGVYYVNDKERVIPLSYKVIEKDKIEVEVKELGRYILSYENDKNLKEQKEEKKGSELNVEKMSQLSEGSIKEEKNKFSPLLIAGMFLLITIVSLITYQVLKKKS